RARADRIAEVSWGVGFLGSGGRIGLREDDATREIETVDDDRLVRGERADGIDAEAARQHAIRASGAAECADALLLQRIDGASVLTARREEALLAFEDHREIRGQRFARRAFTGRADAEH